jgi:hypothetical protein
MINLLEFDVQKGCFYQLVLCVALLTKLLSGFLWNHCPDSNGISVRFPVELVSRFLWNTQATGKLQIYTVKRFYFRIPAEAVVSVTI